LVGAVVLALVQPVHSMQRFSTPPGAPGMQLGKKQPGPALTAAQQATIKRRVMTAMSGLDRIHVVGSAPAPAPPEVLDALAEWRDHNAKDVEMWWDPDTRTPFFIKGNDLALPTPTPLAKLGHDLHTAAALGTFTRLPEFLGLRNAESELRPLGQQTDHLGMTHVRFQQTYRGHDVWARDLYCHFTPDSRMNLINGRWAPTPVQLDGVNPSLGAPAAIEAVRTHFADRTQIETSDTTLVVYIDSDQTPHWAWMVRTSLGPTEGYDVFIDAVTGGYLHQVSFVYSDGPVVGSGVDLFGQTRTVNAYQVGSWYYMINTTKPMFSLAKSQLPNDPWGAIQIWDKLGLSDPYWYYVRSSNPNSWGDAAVSAARNLSFIYDYFQTLHGRNCFDDSGSTLPVVVNDPMVNSVGNNATWSQGVIRLGIGGTITYNWAGTLDLTAHEFTHGVVEYSAGLVYNSQPGALSESFADIFGVLVEHFVEGASSDWLLGEDIMKPPMSGVALRDMQDPGSALVCGTDYCPKQPATMSFYDTTSSDDGGVHINSGIPNHAFYLIANSVGLGKADSIYYRCLTTGKLPRNAKFIDLRRGILQSASELYDGNSAIANAIALAFDAVEIFDGPPTPPPVTQPAPTSAQWIIARDDLTWRLARFDTAGTFLGYTSAGLAIKKPSVPDSGDAVYFIDNTSNVRFVNPDGTGEAQIGNPGTLFANIAVSPDGSRLVYDIVSDPKLYFFDLKDTTGASDFWWPLYTPTYSESTVVNDVLEADVLEWDIYGQNVMFDCLNALPRQSDTVLYWDIRTMDVATGRIQRTLPSIPPGYQIGNPSFGKIHPDLIAFDYFRGDSTFVYAANLSRNSLQRIATAGLYQGRPSFSPGDERVIIEFNSGAGPNLWRSGFNPDSLKTVGVFQMVVAAASFPNWRFTGRDTPVDVTDTDNGPAIPSAFSLYQNYPNPFNASTVISYDARSVGPVALEVFNILGQRVFVRNEEGVLPGRHTFTWNGADQSGASVPSGLYLYRVSAGGVQQTRKMVLLK